MADLEQQAKDLIKQANIETGVLQTGTNHRI